MSFSSSSDIAIDVIATDDASAVLATVQGNLNGVATSAQGVTSGMTNVGVATAGTTTSMVSNISAITQVTAGFTAMAFSVVGLERAQTMLDRTNLMVERDTLTLEKATITYNNDLAKLGPNAVKTSEAFQAMTIAQQKLAVDTERASVAQQNFDLQIVQMAAVGIPMFLMGLAKLPAAYTALQSIGTAISNVFTGTTTGAEAAAAAAGTDASATTALAGSEVAAEAATVGLGTALGVAGVAIAAIGALADKLYIMFGQLHDVMATGTSDWTKYAGVLLGGGGIQDILVQLGLMPKAMDTSVSSTTSGLQVIQTAVENAGKAIIAAWTAIWGGNFAGAVAKAFSGIQTAITGSLGDVTGWFAGVHDKMQAAWAAVWVDLDSVTTKALSTIQTTITAALSGSSSWFSGVQASITTAWTAVWAGLGGVVTTAFSGLQGIITTALGNVSSWFTGLTTAFTSLGTIVAGALGGVVVAVTGFLSALKAAFQDFYNFLVGGSLWIDLWNKVASITQAIGGTVAGIITGLFTAWEGIFSAGMQAIQTIMTTGLQMAFAAGKTVIQLGIDFMKTLVQGFITVITTAQTTWAALFASVSTKTALMRKNLQDFMDWALPFWSSNWQALADTATNDMLLIVNAVKNTCLQLSSVWNATMSSMASQEKSYFETIVADISAQVDAIIAKLNAAQHRISHGSIWPDMFTAMVAQTRAGMGDIQGIFASSLTGPEGIVPMLQTAAPEVAGSLGGAPAAVPAGDSQALNITVPIYLDGQQIATQVQKILVKTLYQNTGRSRRTSTLV